jgi:excinuclease ABC subunit C
MSPAIKEKLDQIPPLPGIYKMLDSRGNIIYVGKSMCLRKRVSSYFTGNHRWKKVEKLVFFTADIDYIVTDTHLEARLLECEMIKKLKPVFNSQMKNDNGYVYLKVESDSRYKVLSVVSERDKYTFGPFRNKHRLNSIIDSLEYIYPIHKANDGYEFELHALPVSMSQTSYCLNKMNLIEIFSHNMKMEALIHVLELKMMESASQLNFESASKYRDIIRGLKYINNGIQGYHELMSQDILLKIPSVKQGYKLFYVSNGTIVSKKHYADITEEDIRQFISTAGSRKRAKSGVRDEKSVLDFRDIIYSEIRSLPKEMVFTI